MDASDHVASGEEKVEAEDAGPDPCAGDFAVAFKNAVPRELIVFWAKHGVDAALVCVGTPWRYFRITGDETKVAPAIRAAWPAAEAVPYLPRFYRVPTSIGLSTSLLYADADICGMDVSSGAVILRGLVPEAGDHVLDLCCAPGVKLMLISEMVGDTGSVTGVDVSTERLNVTRNILRKYNCNRVRLFDVDGQSMNALAPPADDDDLLPISDILGAQSDSRPKYGPISRRMLSPSGSVQLWHDSDFRIKQSLYAVAERSKRAKKKHRFDLPSLFWSNHHELRVNSYNLYDKVLVDAECTTDGAIMHHVTRAVSEKPMRDAEAARGHVRTYRTQDELDDVIDTQKQLITRGWQLLKPGGVLVYSTCSLVAQQNEGVVEYLLDKCPDALLEPFVGVDTLPVQRSAKLKHAVYFRPADTGGNAMFAARLRKRGPN